MKRDVTESIGVPITAMHENLMRQMSSCDSMGFRGIIQCVRLLRFFFLILAPGQLGVILADENDKLRVMSYNIRHGQGMDGQVDLARTAATIARYTPDIIGLQEVDVNCQRSGGIDQPQQLGKALNMQPAFGSFMDFQGGNYGLAILSKLPIRSSRELRLPQGNEPRVALAAEVLLPDESSLLVVNVHFDWVRDDQFRYSQAKDVHQFLTDQKLPFIVLGDFNDSPESRTLELFRSTLVELPKPAEDRFTFSSTNPTLEIDYIFLSRSAAWRATKVDVANEPVASDHRPLVAELVGSKAVNEHQGVTVRLSVELPEESTTDLAQKTAEKKVYVSGNIPELGDWKPDALELQHLGDQAYVGQFRAKVGSNIEYKITQGSWATVEKNSLGLDIPNRTFTVDRPVDSETVEIEIQVEGWADQQHESQSSIQGDLKWHYDVGSKFVAPSRHVAVWLPPGYENPTTHFPVIYLQDGQNLFDTKTAAFGAEWRVDDSAKALIKEELIEPIIIVGVWNSSDRMDEYTTTEDDDFRRGGKGEAYIRFLVEELKPMIDREYRTLPGAENTTIGGSSLGGLISIHAWFTRPDCFGNCLAFSPSLHWDNDRILMDLAEAQRIPKNGRIWFSMGTSEGSSEHSQFANINRARRLAELLRQSREGSAKPCEYLEVQHGEHNESAWAVQFPQALKYLHGRSPKDSIK